MSFQLLSDRVAVIPDEESAPEKVTESGLVIPVGDVGPLKPVYGTVKFVGIGHRSEHNGELVPMDVQPGQRVMFHDSSGEKWEFAGTEYRVLAPSQIIGIMNEAD